MRKGLMLILTFICLFTLFETEQALSEATVEMIPEEAIRLRILANSNTTEDQQLKYDIRDEVNQFLYPLVKDVDDIEETRHIIQSHLADIEEVVATKIKEEGYTETFTVDFRKDVAFPVKKYGPYLYPAGNYEALLITIGDGLGDNWWCVLFPSLCYLDLSMEEKEEIDEADRQATEEKEEIDGVDRQATEEKQKISFFLFDLFKKA